MAYQRTDRISEEVRKEVDKIIRDDVRDPRISGTYSITRADVTRDLRYAKIFVSVYETEKREPLIAALIHASGFIRRELGQRVKLRYTPELLFELDTNIEHGARIIKLINDVVGKSTSTLDESDETDENNLGE